VWTFGLTWLVDELGWAAGFAGIVVAGTQLLGAVGRIGAGHASDLVRSRTRPMQWIAWAAAATMLALGVAAAGSGPVVVVIAVALLVVASTVTVADNGLAYAAVAERAGAFWSGRALGIQNTGQYLVAAAVPPLAGAAITAWGYGVAFGLAAAFGLVAAAVVPVAQEHPLTDHP
jgi:MFS family permease